MSRLSYMVKRCSLSDGCDLESIKIDHGSEFKSLLHILAAYHWKYTKNGIHPSTILQLEVDVNHRAVITEGDTLPTLVMVPVLGDALQKLPSLSSKW
jgi:hypothetical protein